MVALKFLLYDSEICVILVLLCFLIQVQSFLILGMMSVFYCQDILIVRRLYVLIFQFERLNLGPLHSKPVLCHGTSTPSRNFCLTRLPLTLRWW